MYGRCHRESLRGWDAPARKLIADMTGEMQMHLFDGVSCRGRIVERTGQTQCSLPRAIAQKFEVSSSGALVAATEGSTKPVTMTITNAGVTIVETFDLRVP
jgi:hypothetical protein